MSSQRGNVKRTRGQKYQNKSAFQNSLHDTSRKTKEMNKLEILEVCKQCKDVIEWKIKYKKYKPLTQPKTCSNCHLKSIKFAYHTLCDPCGKKLDVCCKCRQPKEILHRPVEMKTKNEVLLMMKKDLKTLPERKRRAFIRFVNTFYDPIARKKEVFKTCQTENDSDSEEENQEEEHEEDSDQNEDDLNDPRLQLLKDEVYCENYLDKIRQKLEELLKGVADVDTFDSDSDESESCGS
ncbi:UNVERIFIED_CONTAM: hypothetical protein RMT77_009922 [Armadillidium vulgare]